MDGALIDVSVAVGFAWRDLDACRRHNDYLLEAAVRSDGRIVPLCTLPLAHDAATIATEARRCIDGGARGFGELRPENLDADLEDPELAAALSTAAADERLLLFHVSEPVGHVYPGKEGFGVGAFYRFVKARPELRIVGAHWGGGLPFYALMPEVQAALDRVWFDTAATSLLYSPDIYTRVRDLVGAGRILFGSDYPLLSQARSRRRIEESGLDATEIAAVLGGNARALLNLE